MVTNRLFEPYRRNHAANSKPLGSWTTRQNEKATDEDEEGEDDE